MTRRSLPLVVTLCLFGSGGARAQLAAQEMHINVATIGAQDDPTVAVGPDGGGVVVWESDGQDGSGDGVFMRALGLWRRGSREVQVNTFTAGAQDDAVVAAAADGSYLVVWESLEQDGQGEGIFGRRLGRRGLPVGEETQVNEHAEGDQEAPAVAAVPEGGFVVVWQSPHSGGEGREVLARRLDTGGAGLGPEFRVNTDLAGDQYAPAVAVQRGGAFLVAWTSDAAGDEDSEGTAVRAQLFGAEGLALGEEIQVNTYTPQWQVQPAAAALAGGGFVVVWSSYGQDGGGYGVFGQRFDGGGQRLGGEFRVNVYTPGFQLGPAVASLPDGGFVVVWESQGQDGSSNGVFRRRYSPKGVPLASDEQVNVESRQAQEDAALAVDGTGGLLVAWESADGDGDGVRARRYQP